MKNKKTLSFVLGGMLAALLIYLVLRQVGVKNMKLYLGEMNYLWIALALLFYTLDMGLRAIRWREILAQSGIRIGVYDSFLAYNLGNTMNIVIPAKLGDLARSFYIRKKYGSPISISLPSLLLDRLFDVIGVLLLMLVSGVYVLNEVKLPAWFYYLTAVCILCIIAVFAVLGLVLRKRDKIKGIKNEKIRELIFSLADSFVGSVKDGSRFIKLLFYAAAAWILDGIVTYAVFLALGRRCDIIEVIFVVMAATLAKAIPVTPGGIGVFEGMMVMLFSILGIDSAFAGIGSALSHLLMNIYTMAVGIYAYFKSGMTVSEINMGQKVQ